MRDENFCNTTISPTKCFHLKELYSILLSLVFFLFYCILRKDFLQQNPNLSSVCWIKLFLGVDIMLKKRIVAKILISLLLVPILFFYLLPSSSANEDNKQLNTSNLNTDKPLSLPDYGPKAFEEAKKLFPGFITTRGNMPVIKDANEKKEWINLLTEYSQSRSLPTGIKPYLTVSGGPVNGFGADINGYIFVSFDPSAPEKVNESIIDKIYKVIDKHFEQKGVSDVPVVFAFVPITNDSAPADRLDANLSDNKEKIANNEKTNKMPGFTSIISILGILIFLIIRRL